MLKEAIDECSVRTWCDHVYLNPGLSRSMERDVLGEIAEQLARMDKAQLERWVLDQDMAVRTPGPFYITAERLARVEHILAAGRQVPLGQILHESRGDRCCRLRWTIDRYSTPPRPEQIK
jgi:hypothetical protein